MRVLKKDTALERFILLLFTKKVCSVIYTKGG